MSSVRNRRKVLEKLEQDDPGPLDEEEQVIVIEELRADNDVWNIFYLRVLAGVGFFGATVKLYFAYSSFWTGEKIPMFITSSSIPTTSPVPLQIILLLEVVDAIIFILIGVSLLLHDPKKGESQITPPSWNTESGRLSTFTKSPIESDTSLEITPVFENDSEHTTSISQRNSPGQRDHPSDMSEILQISSLVFCCLLLAAVVAVFYGGLLKEQEFGKPKESDLTREEILWEIFWFGGLNLVYSVLSIYTLRTIRKSEQEFSTLSQLMYPYKSVDQ